MNSRLHCGLRFPVKCVVAAVVLAVVPSCSAERRVVNCQSLISDVSEGNRGLVTGRLRPDLADKAEALRRDCKATFERNMQLALYSANSGDPDSAVSLLREIASNDAESEPRRLNTLYWVLYRTFSRHEERGKVAADARARFPDSPYTRLIGGAEDCINGRGKAALTDLQYADSQLHEFQGLPFLAFAYAANDDFANAASTLDLLQRVTGGRMMEDRTVYTSVVTYVNMGRDADAVEIYQRFLQDFPQAFDSNFIRKSRAVLMQSGNLPEQG
ncbi:tetratricopeptide repeat protein [Lysobacter auxotrophicus]|uniref:Tetratricopeptide repeat protein n=1 Tax=Lysobacter auxotrophicus TaxID=2992573 RepID=A0ABN6UF23_9GAMM|nr:tetratricopeptide repeat protein [Lysobacter auxotrophicus]BDU14897.1 hypothetical protein LA521A_00980 [Lysobacter auxotrophicus]